MSEERPFRHLSGEALRKMAKRADDRLGAEIDRLQVIDAQFSRVLHLAIALEAEVDARKNR